MKLLIVAATEGEIAPFRAGHALTAPEKQVDMLISGVGMVAATYSLTRHLRANEYDLVLQVGAGGSFDPKTALGSLVFVTSDRFADLGAEDHERYLDIFDIGLENANKSPYSDGTLKTPLLPVHEGIVLPRVDGITVNMVSGNEATINMRSARYKATIESMEGAALHYVCLQENVPFAQVRAISNYVTPRDKSQWKMKEAITNLNDWLISFLRTL